jgi:hypothetical protein
MVGLYYLHPLKLIEFESTILNSNEKANKYSGETFFIILVVLYYLHPLMLKIKKYYFNIF